MEPKVRTSVTVIRGKEALAKDAHLQILPRIGDTLKLEGWPHKWLTVLRVEHVLSANLQLHTIRIFVR
jgi:hypothetical protein